MHERGLAAAADEGNVVDDAAIPVEQAEVTGEIVAVDGRQRHRASSTSPEVMHVDGAT